uniref:Receptor ligand binding region domain-containing protein n=1 Tax=Romanomermis culicivorax TaxID=13658 RepID=A0A915IDX1_ROMCU
MYFHQSGIAQQQRRQQLTTENRRCQSRDRPSWLSSNEQPTPLTIGGLFASDLATMHNQPGLYNLYRDGFGNAPNDPKGNFSISRLIRRTIDMALVDIRRHPCILNGFKLKIQNEDTQCKPTKGMKILFDIMSGKVPKLALFGAVCSNVNEPLAMTAKYFKMVQLSYTETHPKFTVDKDSYSFFYSVVPAFRNINVAQIHLLKTFDWRRVGIIVQRDDARYALPQEEVQSALETKYSIKVEASVGFSHRKSNIHDELTTLKKLDVRIFIGFFNETAASEIFCQASKLGLTKEVHVWFLASFSTGEWWKENRSNCTDRELADALNGHFMFSFAPLRTDRGRTISHKDVRYFRKRYLRHVCPRNAAISPRCAAFKFGGYVYDGVWTLAVALEKLVVDIAKQRSQKFEALGTVRFDNNQRQGLIKIAQFQRISDENYVKVGEFDAANENFYLNYNKTVWNGSVAPTDRIDFLIETRHVDFIVFFVMCAVTTTGIVVAFWFLFMNIYFRNHR